MTSALAALGLSLTLATNVAAGERIESSGYDILTGTIVDTTDLGEGHSLLLYKGASVLVTDNKNDPFNLTAGYCTGSLEFLPDGTMNASGYCTRKDKDGDVHSLSWKQGPGEEKGVWELTSGTGKWAGAKGSGWYQQVMAEGEMSASQFGGHLELP
jgi:hypothetical protein